MAILPVSFRRATTSHEKSLLTPALLFLVLSLAWLGQAMELPRRPPPVRPKLERPHVSPPARRLVLGQGGGDA